jgi:hypothetical protein
VILQTALAERCSGLNRFVASGVAKAQDQALHLASLRRISLQMEIFSCHVPHFRDWKMKSVGSFPFKGKAGIMGAARYPWGDG